MWCVMYILVFLGRRGDGSCLVFLDPGPSVVVEVREGVVVGVDEASGVHRDAPPAEAPAARAKRRRRRPALRPIRAVSCQLLPWLAC